MRTKTLLKHFTVVVKSVLTALPFSLLPYFSVKYKLFASYKGYTDPIYAGPIALAFFGVMFLAGVFWWGVLKKS